MATTCFSCEFGELHPFLRPRLAGWFGAARAPGFARRGIPFLEGADRFAFSAALGATLVRVGSAIFGARA